MNWKKKYILQYHIKKAFKHYDDDYDYNDYQFVMVLN